MHNFYEITSQHIGIILQVHGFQKENSHIIFVNYGTFIILLIRFRTNNVPFHVHGICAFKIKSFKFFSYPKNFSSNNNGGSIFLKIFQIQFGMTKVNKIIYEILISNIDMV